MQKAFRAKATAAEATRDAELARLKRLAKIERERLIKEELGIPGFNKALQANIGCPHTRTKAWGDKYGSGLRWVEGGRGTSLSNLVASHCTNCHYRGSNSIDH